MITIIFVGRRPIMVLEYHFFFFVMLMRTVYIKNDINTDLPDFR